MFFNHKKRNIMTKIDDRNNAYFKNWENWIREEDPHGFKEIGGEQNKKNENKSINGHYRRAVEIVFTST